MFPWTRIAVTTTTAEQPATTSGFASQGGATTMTEILLALICVKIFLCAIN